MTARKILIFDTTLRDGEQAPGFTMNLREKLELAKRLEHLGVDVIEAGFPVTSRGDFEAVESIAAKIKKSAVAALCRCREDDIDTAYEALSKAKRPRLHVFIATSSIHMEHKLKMTPDEILHQAVSSVKHAKKLCADVEFSAEDGSRSNLDFICRVFAAVIKAGAKTVNFADTVGYSIPQEFGSMVKYIKQNTDGIEKVKLSVHCHNDLGNAVANSLSAISNGADQVECTVNGIGERAGNASLEEIVMNLRVRGDLFFADTGIDSTQLLSVSNFVSQVTGVKLHPNKAIVGENTFAHESGIHQHGVIADPSTYEIMTPESIGFPAFGGKESRIVLGKHSGKHALEVRLKELGFLLDAQSFKTFYVEFKNLSDKKKVISDRDLQALAMEALPAVPETWKVDNWTVNTSSALGASGTIRLKHKDGYFKKELAMGDGPIDSIYKAINLIIAKEPELELYELGSISGGSSSQGESMVRIAYNGRRWNGRGVSTDVIESSIKAYIAAVNAMEYEICQNT